MSESPLQRAVEVLRGGGIVAYPTEAVYGLGCDPCNEAAVQRLLRIKQRNPDKGLILIATTLDQLAGYLLPLDAGLRARVTPSWPGPVTWVLPARPGVSALLRGAHDTLAVRVTAHPIAAALCTAFNGPIVSTSANISADAPARSAAEVRAIFGTQVDFIVDGAVGPLDRPTEIRNASSGETIRPG